MNARILPDMIVFLEVVRAGSLTRAAARLNTVQSNVTARIKHLEEAVGQPLLRRHARGIKPTPAGEVALALALRLDGVMEDLRFSFGQRAAGRIVKLRLGAIETVAASQLPSVAGAFAREHPTADISVHTGSSAAMLKQLKEGDLDAVFVSRSSGLSGFQEQVVFNDELMLVAAPTVESLAELVSPAQPPLRILVQRLGCSFTERLLTYLAKKPRRDYRVQELGTLEGILGFVEVGVGVAVMPRSFARPLVAARKLGLLPLPRELRRLQTYLVTPARSHAPFIVNEFFAFCRALKAVAPRS